MAMQLDLQDDYLDDSSLDAVYDLLADCQRRRLLVALYDAETPRRLPGLAHQLANERGDPTGADRVDARIYHCHIPKCEAVGMVQYDDEQDTLALTEQGEKLACALR